MEHPLSAFCLRAQRALIGVAVAGSALVVWPSRSEPFGLPKATLVLMVAVVVVALALVRGTLSRRSDVPVGAIPIAMTVVIAAMTLATFASATPLVSAVGPTRYTGLVPYLACYLIALVAMSAFRGASPRVVAVSLLIAGAVQVVYGLVQSLGLQPLPFGAPSTPVFGTLGNANFLSGWIGLTAPVALWAALEPAHSRNWRRAAGVLTAGCVLVLWRANSFQGLPAAAAGLALVTVVWAASGGLAPETPLGRRVRGLPRQGLAAGVGAAVLIVAVAGIALAPAIIDRIGSGGAARVEFWSAARRLVSDHPVLGTGPGTFVQHYAAYYEPRGDIAFELADDPHSVPLAMFTNGGFLLGLAYLALVAITGFVLVRGLRRTEGRDRFLLAALGGAWVAYQVQSAVSIDIPPLAVTHWVLAASIAALAGSLRFPFAPDAPAEQRPRSRNRRGRTSPLPTRGKVAVGTAVLLVSVLLVLTTRPMRGIAAADRVDPLIRAGDPQRALEEARRAVELAPWDDRAWAEYERVAEGLGEADTARRAARRAVELAPGNSTYALELASLAQKAQDHDEAVRWSLHAAKVDPRNTTVLARAARTLLTYGRGDQAEELVRRGLRIEESADLWGVLGLRFTLDGQESKAIDAYRKALARDPAYEEARVFLEARDAMPDA